MRAQWMLLALVVGGLALAAEPTPRYFTVPIDKLEITEGSLPPGSLVSELVSSLYDHYTAEPNRPKLHAKLDGPNEVEAIVEGRLGSTSWGNVFLAVAATGDGPIAGRIEWTASDKKTGSFQFRTPATVNTVRSKDWFNYGRAFRLASNYGRALDGNGPGQAWFRRQLQDVENLKPAELACLWDADQPRGTSLPTQVNNRGEVVYRDKHSPNPRFNPSSMEPNWRYVEPIFFGPRANSFTDRADWRTDFSDLLSGGRAISENLQLHRNLNVRAGQNEKTVRIADVPGITIKEFDWAPHVKDLKPQLDPLASLIPSDQHAVFLPSVAASLAVLDEIDRTGLAIFQLSATQSVDSRLTDRYLHQLGIPAAKLGALLPPTLVNSVAVTGGDLYYDTGTDVAVLLGSDKPAVVRQLITAMWPALRVSYPDAIEDSQVINGVTCRILRTDDRRLCVYVAELKGALLLTNSPAQVKQLAEVQAGRKVALAALPEYTFFRDRYRRGEADETGFAILPDATIRRWCGPRWRIAHHRQLMNGSVLADVHAAQLTAMIAGKENRSVDWPGLGPVQVTPHSALAPALGTRLFQTPIGEVELETASTAEAEAYGRWRESYQRNWLQFFDPIAMRITAKPERVALDVSVMPLIAETRYRNLLDWSQGAKLPPTVGDPHPEAVAHFVIGFNRDSNSYRSAVREADGWLRLAVGVDSWIGDWFSIYADDDPLWERFAQHEGSNDKFWREHHYKMPVAMAVGVRDPLKLALFLTGLKAYIQNAAPNLLSWASSDHREVTYLRITSQTGFDGVIYSLPLPDMWVLSLNEDTIKRAIDRHLARKESKAALAKEPWLGDSAAIRMQPSAVRLLNDYWGRSQISAAQQASWENLPILNEWKRIAPNSDPVTFHEKWWGERLLCPAGGSYVWNEADGTMESTALGHPGRPKVPASIVSPVLRAARDVRAGVTFEPNGLRAKIELMREAK